MLVKIYKRLIDNAKVVFIATFCACVLLSAFAFKLGIDASADSLMLDDDKDLEFFRQVSKDYASDDFLMLAIKPKDENPFSAQSLSLLKALKSELESIDGIKGSLSILNAPLLQSTDDTDLKHLLQSVPNLTSADINASKARTEILQSPFYRDNIISKDGKSTAFVIYLGTDFYHLALLDSRANALNSSQRAQIQGEIESYQEELKIQNKERLNAIRAVIAKYEAQTNGLYLGGVSMIADDMISYIKADLLVYGVSLMAFFPQNFARAFHTLCLRAFTWHGKRDFRAFKFQNHGDFIKLPCPNAHHHYLTHHTFAYPFYEPLQEISTLKYPPQSACHAFSKEPT